MRGDTTTMSKQVRISAQTRKNWLIDAAVFFGGIVAALTGIYFLFLPSGGYQGGRNSMYGVTILFERHTWSDLHTWGGIAMIVAVAVHFAIHWQWVKRMARRTVSVALPQGDKLSRGALVNVTVDLVIVLSFLLCAVSGIYFLFLPEGGFEGGRNLSWDPNFLFSRVTWDLIHSWSGIAMIVAAVVHFVIHWRWVKNVTTKFFLSLLPQRQRAGVAVAKAGSSATL
jgi:cytochrome b subunit of formate dehydrogenase